MRGMLAIAALTLLISGCTDKGPWDGPFGLKSDLTHSQLDKLLEFKPVDKSEINPKSEWGKADGFDVYESKKLPDYKIEDGEAWFYFNSSSLLCSVEITESMPYETVAPILEYLSTKYGQPEKIKGDLYTYPTSKHDLGENVRQFLINPWSSPVESIDGWVNIKLEYITPEMCN